MTMTCARCCSNTMLNMSATLYLVIAVVVIAIAGSTFFTDWGQIVDPLYAISFMGGGVAVFLIAVVGYCAACSKNDEGAKVQGGRCSLWLFTFLTFCMLILTIASIALMFQYETVLSLASTAGLGDETSLDADAMAYKNLYGTRGTEIVETLMDNTFDACKANVTATSADTFTFACGNDYFNVFEEFVNLGCFHKNADISQPLAINGSTGSYFDKCYEGDLYSAWPVPASDKVASIGLDGALNTPKGLYCACQSTIIEGYVLPYISFGKYVAIVIVVFFFLVFVACVHQMCKRGCCKAEPEPTFTPAGGQSGGSQKGVTGGWSAGGGAGGVQMGYGSVEEGKSDWAAPQNGKKPPKKASKYNDDFLARP